MTREEINNELDRAFEVLVHCGHMDMRRREAFYIASVVLSEEPHKMCFDGMTNGEVVMLITGKEPLTDVFGSPYMTFSKEWWDEPYKAESEVTQDADSD